MQRILLMFLASQGHSQTTANKQLFKPRQVRHYRLTIARCKQAFAIAGNTLGLFVFMAGAWCSLQLLELFIQPI